MRAIILASTIFLIAATQLAAQSEREEIAKTVDETVSVQKRTQEQQDQWAKEKAELTLRLRSARANVDYLTKKKVLEMSKAEALSQSIDELERRLDESARLQAGLQDTLSALLERLEVWTGRDLPFLVEERQARVASLRQEIVNPNTIGAEKLRLILQALMVETNYGNSIEVTQAEINLGREKLFVDMLRLGRVSIFWRTTDGTRVGEFDRARWRWVELPGKYARQIGDAMEMAARIRPVEVTSLPLGRIQP